MKKSLTATDAKNADLSGILDDRPSNRKIGFRDQNLEENPFSSGRDSAMRGGALPLAKKRQHVIDEDPEIKDRAHRLRRENLIMKEKENLLEREILK